MRSLQFTLGPQITAQLLGIRVKKTFLTAGGQPGEKWTAQRMLDGLYLFIFYFFSRGVLDAGVRAGSAVSSRPAVAAAVAMVLYHGNRAGWGVGGMGGVGSL